MYSFYLLFISILISSTAAAFWVEEWTQFKYHFTSSNEILQLENATILVPGVKYTKEHSQQFNVYCYPNVDKSVFQIWRSVQFILLDIPPNYEIFHGVNESEVLDNYHSKSILIPSLMFSGPDSIIEFPAFSNYCIGIDSRNKYSFFLKVRIINYWKVLQTFLGIFIFISSPDLSRNSFFHYASGITFGVLTSFLILLYFLSRFIPQKSASYAVLVFGYSFVLYLLKVFWHHLHDILTQHLDIILSYCIVTAFLSFMVCYRLGPVKNERTCNIIQWSMQALSLMLIFFSSEYRELSTAIIMLLLTVQLVPTQWIKWIKILWYKCFPPKLKFLTELEYIEQGNVETKKALEDLRNYCNSPDCKVWKIVRHLKDPVRFANFIENGSHYTDEELLDYNSEEFNEYLTDVEFDGNTEF